MGKLNKALFLDRDGVINRERGEYTFLLDDFDVLPSLIPTLKIATNMGYLIIVITNQGGIAKGIYTHSHVDLVHRELIDTLAKEDIKITDIFYSPYHTNHGKSLSRKPGSLMFEKAIAIHQIDPKSSFMIGDSQTDITASEAVGVKGFFNSIKFKYRFYFKLLKMSTYISVNTKILPADKPVFTVNNRSFRYGDSLFETIKCVDGTPLLLEAHLQRITTGMQILEFEPAPQLTTAILNDQIKQLLVKNKHTKGARVRLTVFRNAGGLYTPETNIVSVLIESQVSSNAYEINKEGLTLEYTRIYLNQ